MMQSQVDVVLEVSQVDEALTTFVLGKSELVQDLGSLSVPLLHSFPKGALVIAWKHRILFLGLVANDGGQLILGIAWRKRHDHS